LHFSTILIFDSGTVPKVRYFFINSATFNCCYLNNKISCNELLVMQCNRMKNKKYLTFGTVPESNIKIVEKCKITTFRLSFQNSLKKTKHYYNISVGLINRTAKNTGRFDLKFFCNCPIRIEITTGVIHEHHFKRKGKFHFDKEAYTKPNKPDLYALHWKSSYDVMLLMFQSRQQHFILMQY
jgi:hypothetical protein